MKLADKIKDMLRDGYDAIEISSLLSQPLFVIETILRKVARHEGGQSANVSQGATDDDAGRSG